MINMISIERASERNRIFASLIIVRLRRSSYVVYSRKPPVSPQV
jgi:hypothetical protein